MSAGNDRRSTREVKIPRNLYKEIGSAERIIRLIKVGLLSLRVTSLEREIADLTKRTGDAEKKITELPKEIDRFKELLEDAIKDRKRLEGLLDEKR